jgi:hypothetical protein
MRTTLLTALIASTCLWPALVHAQTGSGGGMRGASPTTRGSSGAAVRPGPPRSPGRSAISARPIVPPAPPSAPPIGPYASPSALDRGDNFRVGPRTYAPEFSRSRGFYYGAYGYGGGSGYITDPFGYIGQPDSSSPAVDRYMREGENQEGYLRLEVQPESAQVFVDGLYAGTVSDFRRSGGGTLDSGPHRIEFRAEGYDSQSVELRIRANDVLSYRGTLTRRDERPELRAEAGPPKTFYVIPRCYAGTSRPRADQLPVGCNVKDVREVPPVIAPGAPAPPAARSVR